MLQKDYKLLSNKLRKEILSLKPISSNVLLLKSKVNDLIDVLLKIDHENLSIDIERLQHTLEKEIYWAEIGESESSIVDSLNRALSILEIDFLGFDE